MLSLGPSSGTVYDHRSKPTDAGERDPIRSPEHPGACTQPDQIEVVHELGSGFGGR
jgi:hypothetical protein